jgi:energy-coupling factor transporter ATP-binding protein EcfA2
VPWSSSPDETFLERDTQEELNDRTVDPETGSRYSLKRLEEFFNVYRRMWEQGEVAKPGTRWLRDNQYCYSMFLTNQHNRDVRLDRIGNNGVLKGQFEPAEELSNTDVDIRPAIYDETDDYEFPSPMNFLPPDTFREIMQQSPPTLTEISVAFPLQHEWQSLEETVMVDKCKRFMASPPPAQVTYNDMTRMQKWAVDLAVKSQHKILYLCGKAGSGKTTVALKICELLKGKVQAGACTGKAASNFNGPTNHSMFGWSHNDFSEATVRIGVDSRKILELRTFYENTETFIIDEVNAMSAAQLALLHETMTQVFNKDRKTNAAGHEIPFGGRQVIFLGDPGQLRPVVGPAIYDDEQQSQMGRRYVPTNHTKRTKAGQILYRQYLQANCIFLQRGQRNCGLLGEICDRLREGLHTDDDLRMLTYQRRQYPELIADYGIHYDNESCSLHNWHQVRTITLQTSVVTYFENLCL